VTPIDLQLETVVQKFAPRNTGHIEDLFQAETLADDSHEITPVLIEAALQFNRATTLLYSLWATDVLEPVMITHDGLSNPAESKPSFDDWQIIHTEIEYSVLTHTYAELDLPHLQAWLAADPTARGNALRCVLAVLQGNHRSAIEHYEHACVLMSEATGIDEALVPGLPALFYALALLRTRNMSGHSVRLAAFAHRLDAQHAADRFSVVVMLLAQFDDSEQNHAPARSTDTEDDHCPWLDLFQALTHHWNSNAKRGRMQSAAQQSLTHHYDRAALANSNWYAAEVATLFRHRNQPLPGAFASHARGWLAGAVSPRQHWQEHLNTLETVSRHHASKALKQRNAAPDKRLAWYLVTTDTSIELQPREQKLGRAGRWNKGRKLKLHALIDHGDESLFASSENAALRAAIGEEMARGYEYLDEQQQFQITRLRELQILAKHPHVYTDADPDTPVTIELRQPAIEIIEHANGDGVLVRMTPYPALSTRQFAPFHLEWINEVHLQVTHYSESQLDLASALTADGLQAPAQAHDRLLNSIRNMAPLIDISSDIDHPQDDAISDVPAERKPYIELSPLQQGLRVCVLLYPLGERGLSVLPGRGRRVLITQIDGQTHRCQRDTDAEHRECTALLQTLQLPDNPNYQWELPNPQSALELLSRLQKLGDQIVMRWPRGEPLNMTPEIDSDQMQLSISHEQNWFEIDGALHIDVERTLYMDRLIDMLRSAQGRFLTLDDGTILALSTRLRQQLETIDAVLAEGRVHPLAIGSIDDVTDAMQVTAPEQWQQQLEQIKQAQTLAPKVPAALNATLRDYQRDGYNWLCRLAHWGAGACLADDMGLGKTLQTLALLLHRATLGPALVLAPTSVCHNWIEEAAKFAPTLNTLRFGSGDRVHMLQSATAGDLIVCSYGLMQSSIDDIGTIEWATIIADEAQAFKNANTRRSQAIMSLNAQCRIITTGTPIENHLGELWNLFRFINPGLLGSAESFNERFAQPIEARSDDNARQALKTLIRPFILRRLKSDVLTELPPRTEITQRIELNTDERAFYEALRQKALARIAQLPDTGPEQRFQVLAEITRLRQAACHPRLVLDKPPVGSAKLRAFAQIVEELRSNGHRCLVFSQFVGHLSLLREYLDEQKIHYQYLDGKTTPAKRKRAVDAFQAGLGELFLISLKAGGAGINLTAADYVIHMDPWWNPAVEDQASDRAHRMGQTRPVTIYRLVVRDTIEDKIVQLHSHKRDLADSLLEGTGQAARMSVEELTQILQNDL
jgi:hypothetical protein